jgi:hypothetical protein
MNRGKASGSPYRLDLAPYLSAVSAATGDVCVYAAVGRGMGWVAPSGYTILLDGSHGALGWQVAYGTVGSVGQYLGTTVPGVDEGTGAGFNSVAVAVYSPGVPSAAVYSTSTSAAVTWPVTTGWQPTPPYGNTHLFHTVTSGVAADNIVRFQVDPADDFALSRSTHSGTSWGVSSLFPLPAFGWPVSTGAPLVGDISGPGAVGDSVTLAWGFA